MIFLVKIQWKPRLDLKKEISWLHNIKDHKVLKVHASQKGDMSHNPLKESQRISPEDFQERQTKNFYPPYYRYKYSLCNETKSFFTLIIKIFSCETKQIKETVFRPNEENISSGKENKIVIQNMRSKGSIGALYLLKEKKKEDKSMDTVLISPSLNLN